jgi:hypothetical protein
MHSVFPKTQKPCADFRECAGTERRARFSYDDLLELFSFAGFQEDCRVAASTDMFAVHPPLLRFRVT